MNQNQIEQLARSAGLTADRAKVAAAVAMAESGGNERAHAQDSDDDSYGLWQINMKGSNGPDRRRRFSLASNEALFDPATNARVMASISQQGRAWSAWGAYTNGSYKKFLVAGGLADVLPGGNAVQDAASTVGEGAAAIWPYDVVNSFRKLYEIYDKATEWVSTPNNWLRVLYVVGGSALVVTSVGMIIGTSALPTAKLAKAAKSLAK